MLNADSPHNNPPPLPATASGPAAHGVFWALIETARASPAQRRWPAAQAALDSAAWLLESTMTGNPQDAAEALVACYRTLWDQRGQN